MDRIEEHAKELGILRGALSRLVLPFGEDEHVTDQVSKPNAVLANLPDEIKSTLSDQAVTSLVVGANRVRQLVRVKMADDNDLETARAALQMACDFLQALVAMAADDKVTPFVLYARLKRRNSIFGSFGSMRKSPSLKK
jgi:hypothetical protein